ncbi:hypothetical protein EAY64_14515 [Aquitalea palustris]|uniref:Uncharacterized protein n=1 Tax=Aquitalea palustris TaxID=2480983 RepID=A0A454JFY7_9NEIS|nr:hypothetical protein [Aquitalea palustris]RMC94938.1 hypothetical protein EAY64_14515 [Aquitalea palustris]
MSSQSTASNPGFVRLFGHTGDDGSITLQAIRERASKQLAKFASLAEEQLVERQISMPPAISLVSCPACSLTLENNHPQSDEILSWLTDNAKLSSQFKEVEVLFELVRAAEAAGEIFPETSCFHIGLTSAGPIAYFEDHACSPYPQ